MKREKGKKDKKKKKEKKKNGKKEKKKEKRIIVLLFQRIVFRELKPFGISNSNRKRKIKM